MIVEGNLLLPDGAQQVKLALGWLRLEGGRIKEVHLGPCPHEADAGGPQALISPGFIDTHLHMPQFDIIGAHGLDLLDWLDQVTFPAETRWANADYAQAMSERVLDQLLAHGTTSFLGYGTIHHDGTRRALDACRKRQMRAVVGQVLIDQEAPESMLNEREASLAQTEALLQDFRDGVDGRVSVAVTPRFAITCSAQLMAQAAELAQRYDAHIQTHLAEMKPELEAVAALHGGPHYTGVYQRAGLLGQRTVLGHCIYLSDEELEILAQTGAVAAHCPTANSFLRSGTMNRARLLSAGVRLSVGSDIGGGYERSMVRSARAMIEATFHAGTAPMSAGAAWWHITAGNAGAMGWSSVGSLQEGFEADVLVIEPDVPWLDAYNPLGMLMFGWDDRWLRQTIVAGAVAFDAAV